MSEVLLTESLLQLVHVHVFCIVIFGNYYFSVPCHHSMLPLKSKLLKRLCVMRIITI